jgi:hypothetical protein
MKTLLSSKKIIAFAAAAFVIFNACLPAYARTALSSDRSLSDDAVYHVSKSVKDSFVLKQDDAPKQNTAQTAAANINGKASSGGVLARLLETFKKLFDDKEEQKKEAKYNAVVNNLVRQSGLDRDVIEKAFSKLEKSKLDAAIDLLSEMFKNNGSIISCGLFALGSALDIPAGEAAFLALVTDIKIGAFRKECLDKNFVYGVSGEAQIEVLRAFGYEKPGIYTMPFNNFLQLMQNGESAILYLKLTIEGEGTVGHVVTVKKELNDKTGKVQYAVFDNGIKSVYSEKEFGGILRGEKSFLGGQNGNKKCTYNAVDAKGKINFLPASNRVWVAPQTSAIFARENADIQNLLKSLISLIKK